MIHKTFSAPTFVALMHGTPCYERVCQFRIPKGHFYGGAF